MTASCGRGAPWTVADGDAQDWTQATDVALYSAKPCGRDRMVAAT